MTRALRRAWSYEKLPAPGVPNAMQSDGTLWGFLERDVLRSTNGWATAQTVTTLPVDMYRIAAIHLLDDDDTLIISHGNVRFGSSLFRYVISTDTLTGPVLEFPVGYAVNWNLDSHGDLVFASEYGNRLNDDNPRRIYKSTDAGETFALACVLDEGSGSHIHRVLYDPHTNVLWASQGDGAFAKLFRIDGPDHDTPVQVRATQPTAGVLNADYILWGEDGGPRGVSRYTKATEVFDFPLDLGVVGGGAFADYVFSMRMDANERAYASTAGSASGHSKIGVFYADPPYESWHLLAWHDEPVGIFHLAAVSDDVIWWGTNRRGYAYRRTPVGAARSLRT